MHDRSFLFVELILLFLEKQFFVIAIVFVLVAVVIRAGLFLTTLRFTRTLATKLVLQTRDFLLEFA